MRGLLLRSTCILTKIIFLARKGQTDNFRISSSLCSSNYNTRPRRLQKPKTMATSSSAISQFLIIITTLRQWPRSEAKTSKTWSQCQLIHRVSPWQQTAVTVIWAKQVSSCHYCLVTLLKMKSTCVRLHATSISNATRLKSSSIIWMRSTSISGYSKILRSTKREKFRHSKNSCNKKMRKNKMSSISSLTLTTRLPN